MLDGWKSVHRTALSVLASLEDILLEQSFSEICMTLRQPIAMNIKYHGLKQFQVTRKMLRKMERKIIRKEDERKRKVNRPGVVAAEKALNSGGVGAAESSNMSTSTTPPTTPRH